MLPTITSDQSQAVFSSLKRGGGAHANDILCDMRTKCSALFEVPDDEVWMWMRQIRELCWSAETGALADAFNPLLLPNNLPIIVADRDNPDRETFVRKVISFMSEVADMISFEAAPITEGAPTGIDHAFEGLFAEYLSQSTGEYSVLGIGLELSLDFVDVTSFDEESGYLREACLTICPRGPLALKSGESADHIVSSLSATVNSQKGGVLEGVEIHSIEVRSCDHRLGS